MSYSRARGPVPAFDVSNATSGGAHKRLSPVALPMPSGSRLNSAGRIAPNTASVATTRPPALNASKRPAGTDFEMCPSSMSDHREPDEITGQLVLHQHEAGDHDEHVGRCCEAIEARRL